MLTILNEASEQYAHLHGNAAGHQSFPGIARVCRVDCDSHSIEYSLFLRCSGAQWYDHHSGHHSEANPAVLPRLPRIPRLPHRIPSPPQHSRRYKQRAIHTVHPHTSISETAPRMRSWRDCEVEDSEAEDRQWAVLKLLRLPFVCQTRLASSSTFRCCRRWFHKDHFRIRSSHCNQYRCEPRRSQAAWGITSKENYEHWTWFLSNLPDSLPNFNTQRTVTMSDRQKGLNKAIKGTLYMVTEAYCCKHIERNLVETYGMKIKSVFWTLMYARTNMPSWQVWLLSES